MRKTVCLTIGVFSGAALLVAAPLPGPAGNASAASVDLSVSMETVNSDNFERLPSGLEDTGTQFTLTTGLDLKGGSGGTSWSVGGQVGSEWVNGNQDTRNLVYRLNTDLQFNRRNNRYVNVTADASRDTSIPEPDLINRNRVREDRLGGSIATGRSGPASSWEIGLRRDDTDREGAQSRSVRLNAAGSWQQGPGSQLRLSGSALRGDDKAADNIWREGDFTIELSQPLNQRSSRGGSLSWSASKTEAKAGATLSRTNNIGVLVFRRSEISAASSVNFSLGTEGFKTEGESREWNGQAGFTFNSQLARKLNFDLDSSASTRVFRNEDRTPAWSRTARISLGLELELSRSWGAFSTTSYGRDNFPRGTAGMPSGSKRRDERFYGQLGFRGQPSRNSEISASMIVEKVNSTLWTADFEENRLELAASILF